MRLIRNTFTSLTGAIAALSAGAIAHAAVLVGVTGEFYNFAGSGSVTSVTQAENLITASSGPDATWSVTGIDYPNGPGGSIVDSSLLSTILGSDAATLSADFSDLTRSAMRFVGQIRLDGTEGSFGVGSDDGFVLRIGGNEISRFETERSFATTLAANPLSAGLYTFELIYFENGGATGVEFSVDGNIVGAEAAVPVPGAALFMLTGLGGLLARKRLSR